MYEAHSQCGAVFSGWPPLARKLCPQALLVLQLLPLTANNLTALTTTATIAATSTNTADATPIATGCGLIFNTSNATATAITDTVGKRLEDCCDY